MLLSAIPIQFAFTLLQHFLSTQPLPFIIILLLEFTQLAFYFHHLGDKKLLRLIALNSITSKILILLDLTLTTTLCVPILLYYPLISPHIDKYIKVTKKTKISNEEQIKIDVQMPIPQQSNKLIRYLHYIIVAVIYSLLTKNTYSLYLLNIALLFEKADQKIVTAMKLSFAIIQQDLQGIFVLALLPNLLQYQDKYAYSIFVEQIIFYYLNLNYSLYHYLLIFLSFYILEQEHSKYLTYLYIPLFVYAFESKSEIHLYSFLIIILMYCALMVLNHSVKILRILIIFIGLLLSSQWYYQLLLFVFIYENQHFILLKYIRCYFIIFICRVYIQYSQYIPKILFAYKYNQQPIEIEEIIIVLMTYMITEYKQHKQLVLDNIIQIYAISFPIWPALLYNYRQNSVIISIIFNLIQIGEMLIMK